ncbi:hypothetical protein GCM10009733_081120 [Nonomuraea maheshkhaliensis]|uniref:Glyoxalase/fosfomycin resistance/dioxygenase domain-containing protein n=1 Tax=Nonomuraea maheshkhaliensis TaxID=419590 RepID=A0ABP4SEG8_9ACTN
MHPILNTIDSVASDLDASIAFYARLGLECKLDEHSPEHAGCDLPDGLHVMLDTEGFRTRFLPGWSAPTGGPRTLPCFEFDTPSGVDATYSELVTAGHRGSPSRTTRSSPTTPTRSPTTRTVAPVRTATTVRLGHRRPLRHHGDPAGRRGRPDPGRSTPRHRPPTIRDNPSRSRDRARPGCSSGRIPPRHVGRSPFGRYIGTFASAVPTYRAVR